MTNCATCGNRDYLCQRCKMDDLEDRLGLPEDHFDADAGIVCWVQDLNDDWHASMYFEGTRHVAACGEVLETPVADVRDDPRQLDGTHTCDACEQYLEADEAEATVPDGGKFEKASELRADGGERTDDSRSSPERSSAGGHVECDLCGDVHDSVGTALRCCSERFDDVETNRLATTVSGPVLTSCTRERGGQ